MSMMKLSSIGSLNNVPTSDIEKYIDVKIRKNIAVKMQQYEEATILREEQSAFLKIYPVLETVYYDELIQNLRDRRIKDILEL